MKTTSVTLIILAMTISSFDTRKDLAADRIAKQIVQALSKSSSFEYSALYPPVESFLEVMDKNATLYNNLAEAKTEFAARYRNEVLPQLNKSFDETLEAGRLAGIDWRTAKFDHADASVAPDGDFVSGRLKIVFQASGKEHTLTIDNALFIKGQWKVSKFVTLN